MDNPTPDQASALVGEIVRHHTLPSGGTVVLRDPRLLRAKDKEAVIYGIQDDRSRAGAVTDAFRGTMAMLVESWHIPYLPDAPLPRTEMWIIGELTIPDYDSLHEAVAPAVALLFPGSKDEDKPGSPTVPAGG